MCGGTPNSTLYTPHCQSAGLLAHLVLLHTALLVLLSASAGAGIVGAHLLGCIADRLLLHLGIDGSGGSGFLGNLFPLDLLVLTDLDKEHPADGVLPDGRVCQTRFMLPRAMFFCAFPAT